VCKDCGCEEKTHTSIPINKSLTEENDKIAHKNEHSFLHNNIICINILGAPGSGKTSMIENLSKHLGSNNIAVIQGDLESSIDKERLEKQNIQTFQINTHSGCHLTASQIQAAIINMDLKHKKYLFIENVGNLVCPAGVKLGQAADIVLSSTTEGSDKPKKYPIIFHNAKLVVITKSDLAQAVDFNEETYIKDLKSINKEVKIIATSTKKPDSFKEVAHFIEHIKPHHHEHKH